VHAGRAVARQRPAASARVTATTARPVPARPTMRASPPTRTSGDHTTGTTSRSPTAPRPNTVAASEVRRSRMPACARPVGGGPLGRLTIWNWYCAAIVGAEKAAGSCPVRTPPSRGAGRPSGAPASERRTT
jgi:hypothetical protein